MNLTDEKEFYETNGYAVVKGLFAPDEVAALRQHFMDLRAEGPKPGDMVAEVPKDGDPLLRFPRMIHMHRWDETTLRWLLDARLAECLRCFLEDEPLAVQTMLYFKPAGARGQALHQDQFYLRAAPGTCMAAWLALDDCDEQNGCMQVVPGSHKWPLLCHEMADTSKSFTNTAAPVPVGQDIRPVLMDAGDVLFFHGQVVHGSYPNTSADRFRRSLIGHYVESKAEQLTKYDQPVLTMDGREFEISDSVGGGPCGVWVDKNGQKEIETTGRLVGAAHE